MQESMGHRLRLMRAERGLSLREAARRAGLVKETISGIERGEHRPHDVTLAKLAKAYEVPLEGLLEEPVPLGENLPVLDPWSMLAEQDGARRAAVLEAASDEEREGYIKALDETVGRYAFALWQEANNRPKEEDLRLAHTVKMRKLRRLRNYYVFLLNEAEPVEPPSPQEAKELVLL